MVTDAGKTTRFHMPAANSIVSIQLGACKSGVAHVTAVHLSAESPLHPSERPDSSARPL